MPVAFLFFYGQINRLKRLTRKGRIINLKFYR